MSTAIRHGIAIARHTRADGVMIEIRDEYTGESVWIPEMRFIQALKEELGYVLWTQEEFEELLTPGGMRRAFEQAQRGEEIRQAVQAFEENRPTAEANGQIGECLRETIAAFARSDKVEFTLDMVYERAVTVETVKQELWAHREAGHDADFFLRTIRDRISAELRKRADKYGLREFVAELQPDGSYIWRRFRCMSYRQLERLIALREEEIADLRRQVRIYREFAALLKDRPENAVVDDVYEQAVEQLQRAGLIREGSGEGGCAT